MHRRAPNQDLPNAAGQTGVVSDLRSGEHGRFRSRRQVVHCGKPVIWSEVPSRRQVRTKRRLAEHYASARFSTLVQRDIEREQAGTGAIEQSVDGAEQPCREVRPLPLDRHDCETCQGLELPGGIPAHNQSAQALLEIPGRVRELALGKGEHAQIPVGQSGPATIPQSTEEPCCLLPQRDCLFQLALSVGHAGTQGEGSTEVEGLFLFAPTRDEGVKQLGCSVPMQLVL